MRTPLLEQPDCYREGGGSLGKFISDPGRMLAAAMTMGTSEVVRTLGKGMEQDMPGAPKGPESIQTGQQVAQKSGGSFDEEAESKSKARQTARKGTSKFRIPLANTQAGAAVSGGTGLKI